MNHVILIATVALASCGQQTPKAQSSIEVAEAQVIQTLGPGTTINPGTFASKQGIGVCGVAMQYGDIHPFVVVGHVTAIENRGVYADPTYGPPGFAAMVQNHCAS